MLGWPPQLSVYSVNGSVESLVISTTLDMRGGAGERVNTLEDDPIIIGFTFPLKQVVYSFTFHHNNCQPYIETILYTVCKVASHPFVPGGWCARKSSHIVCILGFWKQLSTVSIAA